MRRLWNLTLALLLCGCLCLTGFAERFTGSPDMTVTLTPEGKIESNLDGDDDPAALEPGDDITFTVRVDNRSASRAEWYLKNEILHSLEDRSAAASGGAYSYRLAFCRDDGTETVLFDSDTVGGAGESPAGVGLHQADQALKNYFYFATLEPGDGGVVTLCVALEGESQGNAYQDTLADLRLVFAAALLEDAPSEPTEEPGTEPTEPPIVVVNTGDDTPLFPLFLAMAISGLALLGLLLYSVLRRRKPREGRRSE